MRAVRFVVLFSLVAVLCLGGGVRAQEPVENQPVADKPAVVAFSSKDEVKQTDGAFASVRGTVRLSNGGSTPAGVTLVETATGQFFSTKLKENGTFEFNQLPPGEFLLFARPRKESEDETDVDSFCPVIRRQVVSVGQMWRVDIVFDNQIFQVGGREVVESPILGKILESEFTVFAKVESVTPVKTRNISDEDREFRIDLRVTQVVRGEKVPERFSLWEIFNKGESPSFSRGAEVFATCRESRGGGKYVPSFLSKTTVSGPEAKFYSEFYRLNRGRVPTQAELIEWLVSGTVNPATRRLASYELAVQIEEGDWRRGPLKRPSTDPFNLYSNGPDFLSENQKTRLIRALFETSRLQEHDQALMDLVDRFENPDFIPFIVRYLRENGESPDEGTGLAFRMLAETTGNKGILDLSRLYELVEESNRSALFLIAFPSNEESALDMEEIQTQGEARLKEIRLEAPKRARAELAALIRAALWAYDHPEAP